MPTRVQRVPETWPVLHLEAEVPEWSGLTIDGLVEAPIQLSLDAITSMGPEQRNVAVHCVWGWSRTDPVWSGIGLDVVLGQVRPLGTHVTVRASSDSYSACLPLADAARGMLVWARDGEPLAPEFGGPLRFLPPPDHWSYKGVKWAARVTVGDRFVPGLWESKVADPLGVIPADVELP